MAPGLSIAWLAGCASAGRGRVDGTDPDAPVEDVPAYESPWDLDEGPPPPLCLVAIDCGSEIPDEPKLDCALRVEDGAGTVVYDGIAGVEVRGRSTYWAPKKQYAIELRTADGHERPVDLLGMGADSDWVLNGTWLDRSLLRTKLAFDLYREFGGRDWAPESALCEAEIDGEWLGIYTLLERVKRGDARIDIEAAGGSGESFVLKLHDSGWFYENAGGYGGWKLIYPDDDAAEETVAAWLDGWYGGLADGDPWDYVDRDGLVDIVLLQEATKNVDAWYLSLHAWKEVDETVRFTPWDLDLSMGQPSYSDNEAADSWVQYRPDFPALVADDALRASLAERWSELRQGPMATEEVLARIDRYQATMGDAIEANFEVWPMAEIDWGDEDWLYDVGSYEEEDARLRAWWEARLAWMDENVRSW